MAEKETTKKKNSFDGVIASLMDGASGVLTDKTTVGEPIVVGDTILIPLSDVMFGCGSGVNNDTSRDSASGGFFAKVSPAAVMIIRGDNAKIVSVKDQNVYNKIVDMVPDVIDKVAGLVAGRNMMDEEDAVDLAFPEEKEEAAE